MINRIKKIPPNKFIMTAAVLNVIGLIFVLLSVVYLTPLTLILSLALGAPLILLSLIIFIAVVIIEERRFETLE